VTLITDPRMTESDLREWHRLESYDARLAYSPKLRNKTRQALDVIRAFFATDQSGYVGVSWGKDSVVVADLVMRVRPQTPMVWVKVWPHANPDCDRVRDAFLDIWPDANYHEIDVQAMADHRSWHTSRTLSDGFVVAERNYGKRHVSGVRAGESAIRELTMMRNGTASAHTCRPVGWWSAHDIFAYLHRNELPVHPAYAFSMGGTIDRQHLRVASLGGEAGTGHNRRNWERVYYRHRIEEITRLWEEITGIDAGGKFVL
jgi:phosphoadenosine phosphosulfate reductase